MHVSIWELADCKESYGAEAGWYILVTPDGEDDVAGPWETAEEAEAFAATCGWEVVPCEL